jgi:hypothetical protein
MSARAAGAVPFTPGAGLVAALAGITLTGKRLGRHAEADGRTDGRPGKGEDGKAAPAMGDPQACNLQSGSAASWSRTVGLAREVRMTDPPRTWILDTSVMDSGRACSIRPSIRCSKPSMIPRTSHPEFRASIVAAEITEFIPGAGPPPYKIPSLTPPSSQPPRDPDKQAWYGRPLRRYGHFFQGKTGRTVRPQLALVTPAAL